jgi:hypothetical protein
MIENGKVLSRKSTCTKRLEKVLFFKREKLVRNTLSYQGEYEVKM